ncbi:MAG TPA: diacylglycerol kinase family protein, partial [Vicinamibacterales bacterium]|nr:diacylglycerol kinase family protein [Vicinamibacterales bacterium]
MRPALVVINPMSGVRANAGGSAEVALAGSVLGEAGFAADVVVTNGPGHATELAREAASRGVELVVAWGGDGTMNEVARALAFGPISLALVPAGSGNGLARELGLPLDAAAALALAGRGRQRRIDAGEANGQLFFNVAGVGLDARVAHRFAESKGRRGLTRYAQLGAQELLRHRAEHYELSWDGGADAGHKLFIALANSRQYGSHGCIAPAARVDDGRLDLVIVDDQPLWRVLGRVPAFFAGTLKPGGGVHMSTFVHARIASSA